MIMRMFIIMTDLITIMMKSRFMITIMIGMMTVK